MINEKFKRHLELIWIKLDQTLIRRRQAF